MAEKVRTVMVLNYILKGGPDGMNVTFALTDVITFGCGIVQREEITPADQPEEEWQYAFILEAAASDCVLAEYEPCGSNPFEQAKRLLMFTGDGWVDKGARFILAPYPPRRTDQRPE